MIILDRTDIYMQLTSWCNKNLHKKYHMERENRTTEQPKNLINVVPLKLAGFFKHHLALQNNMFAASDLNVFMPIFFAAVGKCNSFVPSVTAPILQHSVFRRV